MIILGLDPSSNCGYAVVRDGTLIEYGTLTVTPSKKAELRDRLLEMSEHITYLFQEWQPTVTVIEDVLPSTFAIPDWKGKLWVTYTCALGMSASSRNKDSLVLVPSPTLKTYWNANSKGDKKPQMIASINKRCGLNLFLAEHNAADAIALAYYYYDQLENVA